MVTKKQEIEEIVPEVAADMQYSRTDQIQQQLEWDEYRQKAMNEERIAKLRELTRLSQELSEPFPREVERVLRKSGTELTYIPVSEVIVRMNKVFGVYGWSSEIIKCERDTLDPDFIVAHVRVKVTYQLSGCGMTTEIQKDGFGGQKIKRTKSGDIVDLGDEFKGAVSDALKKAVQQFGIGLYLSRSEESLMLEEEQEHAAAVAAIDPTVRALWEQFTGLSKDLDANQKAALGSFWNNYSGGKPKPTIETATPQVVTALIEECTRLLFPGSEFTTNDK